MRRRKVECPVCHKTAEIASMSHWLFAHHCLVTHSWWYTNGILFSTDSREITVVERTPRTKGTSGENGQVPGKVIQAQCESWSQNQPSPA